MNDNNSPVETCVIDAVSCDYTQAILDTGEIVKIIHLYDCDGEECLADVAVVAIADLGGRFAIIDLMQFETVTAH